MGLPIEDPVYGLPKLICQAPCRERHDWVHDGFCLDLPGILRPSTISYLIMAGTLVQPISVLLPYTLAESRSLPNAPAIFAMKVAAFG